MGARLFQLPRCWKWPSPSSPQLLSSWAGAVTVLRRKPHKGTSAPFTGSCAILTSLPDYRSIHVTCPTHGRSGRPDHALRSPAMALVAEKDLMMLRACLEGPSKSAV